MTPGRRLGWLAIGLALSAVLPTLSAPAQATPFGKLNVTGAVTLTATGTDFLPPAGPTQGAFLIDPNAAPTSAFAGLGGTTGSALDFTTATAPVGVPFTLNNFITFAALPGVTFDLTFINPGVFTLVQCAAAPAAGQTCTPPGSAFNLANTTATNSVLSFTMAGTAADGIPPTTPFEGTLTAQFTGMNYQQVLATLAAGGSVVAAYSADFLMTTQTNTVTPTSTGTPTGTATVTSTATATATSTSVAAAPEIPTLSTPLLALLALVLAALGILAVRRRE